MSELELIKERVKKRLREKNIEVYFIAFEDDPFGIYYVYTFNGDLFLYAWDTYTHQEMLVNGAYDDFAISTDPAEEIVYDITERYKELEVVPE